MTTFLAALVSISYFLCLMAFAHGLKNGMNGVLRWVHERWMSSISGRLFVNKIDTARFHTPVGKGPIEAFSMSVITFNPKTQARPPAF
jgi:hypothetical protein